MKKLLYTLAVLISALLLIATWFTWIPFNMIEMLGFVSGGWTVWLTVKENVWNWPIGIANSAFFLVLFLRSGLYADSGLQVFYIVLGLLGWYWWLYGGKDRTQLNVQHASAKTLIALAAIIMIATWPFAIYLRSIQDAAPFLDALTTVLSLVAQYLLTKKYIENWYIWMFVDVIYIGLYIYKQLNLTAVLYFIFLCMCVRGFIEWRQTLHSSTTPEHNGYA